MHPYPPDNSPRRSEDVRIVPIHFDAPTPPARGPGAALVAMARLIEDARGRAGACLRLMTRREAPPGRPVATSYRRASDGTWYRTRRYHASPGPALTDAPFPG